MSLLMSQRPRGSARAAELRPARGRSRVEEHSPAGLSMCGRSCVRPEAGPGGRAQPRGAQHVWAELRAARGRSRWAGGAPQRPGALCTAHAASRGRSPDLQARSQGSLATVGAADTQQAASRKQNRLEERQIPQEMSEPNRNRVHPPGGRMGCPRSDQTTVLFQNSGQEADPGGQGAWRSQGQRVIAFSRPGAAWGRSRPVPSV